jgi:predicted MFS family arabinose efflux permease
VELVGEDNLMNAIGLNSSIFNAARVLGPAFAGVVMAVTNIGNCFLLNGLSFLAVLLGLALMRIESRTDGGKTPASILSDLTQVLSYVRAKKEVFRTLVAAGLVGVFGWSLPTLAPVFARDILNVGEKGYGFLLATGGFGALLAALSVAAIHTSDKVRRISAGGILMFCLSAGVFAWSVDYELSLVAFAGALFGLTTFFVASNTFIQLRVPDHMRGAVMGIWTLVFGGTAALGNLQIGFLSERFGPQWAVFLGAAACLAAIWVLRDERAIIGDSPASTGLHSPS